ncbi:vWA domain-containing protein [Haloplanus halophilus]|uniref:vWA domain-containing protein n=1 Tax=Haloplanus halophilus TaxID=2949993 RepID=UPI0020410F03|nr:vWA domain-containing protein [Haloplanus sp. GDY1]
MSNEFELSRRKALAALGTIGVASAGAGLGTSAYFSDQETFQNNELTAGELDLKVDWEEHYSDWSDDEANLDDDNPDNDLDIVMDDPDDVAYVGLPYPDDPLIWVHEDDLDEFMANTGIDAFPDPDNSGTGDFPDYSEMPEGSTVCDYLADVGADDEGLSTFSDPDADPPVIGRTDGPDTRTGGVEIEGEPKPLVALDDVKPGDFGEITFSTHLCDNDGYLWMNADNVEYSENGVTEPEADDPDEEDGVVELPDVVQTALWYDGDCDNVLDEVTGELDIVALADVSGSIDGDEMTRITDAANIFIEQLSANTEPGDVEAALYTFGSPHTAPDEAVNEQRELQDLSNYITGGNGNLTQGPGGEFPNDPVDANATPMPAALDIASQVLDNEGRPDAKKVIVLVTDGGPNYAGDGPGGGTVTFSGAGHPYTSEQDNGSSDGNVSDDEKDETASVASSIFTNNGYEIWTVGITDEADLNMFLETGVAQPGTDQHTNVSGDFDGINAAALELANAITGQEEVIFQGTLRELLTALQSNDGRGIPLDAGLDTEYFETGYQADNGPDPEDDPDRECFRGLNTYCFGLAWWLPVNHGNEIQTDSAEFDIGFYTEQCRHNDGAGMNNESIDA